MRRYTEEEKSTIILDSEEFTPKQLVENLEGVYDYIDNLLMMVDPAKHRIDPVELRDAQYTLEALIYGTNIVSIEDAKLKKGGLR